jgi:hypothetical protein
MHRVFNPFAVYYYYYYSSVFHTLDSRNLSVGIVWRSLLYRRSQITKVADVSSGRCWFRKKEPFTVDGADIS